DVTATSATKARVRKDIYGEIFEKGRRWHNLNFNLVAEETAARSSRAKRGIFQFVEYHTTVERSFSPSRARISAQFWMTKGQLTKTTLQSAAVTSTSNAYSIQVPRGRARWRPTAPRGSSSPQYKSI